ncbi:MAG TPA: DinB family protein [Terriglobia bacterium]|nr:DinB family protein [Terriglobia bacterium]
MDLREFFLKQKQATHKNTLKVFEAIPPDQLHWRPAAGMLSLGQIVRHVWMSEDGVRRVATEGRWDYYEKRVPQGLFAILGDVASLSDELARLHEVNEQTLAAAAAFPLERWEEERRDERFGVRTKVAVMLFGINEHQAHHRAQAGVYLHLLTGQRASHYAL